MENNTTNKEANIRKNKDKKKNAKNREEYGYGYDMSVEDLKVLGQNDAAKKITGMMASEIIMVSGIHYFYKKTRCAF